MLLEHQIYMLTWFNWVMMLKILLCFTGVNSILKCIKIENSYFKICNNIFHFHNITYYFCKNKKSWIYIFDITLRNTENNNWNKGLIVQPWNFIFFNLIKLVFKKYLNLS